MAFERDCGCPTPNQVVGQVARLVHQHRARLAAVARDEGLRPADAFDVVQEAFGRFLQLPEAPRLAAAPDEAPAGGPRGRARTTRTRPSSRGCRRRSRTSRSC
jgi:hypothetical protein